MTFPALFISHGSPMILQQQSPARQAISELSSGIPRPEAIIIMTAHWLTGERIGVSSWNSASLIYDFYGFPAALYNYQYPASGMPALADNIVSRLQHAGLDSFTDKQRGLDHGSWVPLLLMYPQADIPVIQISVPQRSDNRILLQLGELLAPLRNKNLLIGSGLLTHNLALMTSGGQQHPDLKTFIDPLTPMLELVDKTALEGWKNIPCAQLFHPSDEHFRPLLFAAGAGSEGRLLHRSIEYSSIAMDIWQFD
ncbi:DODA-type extradiol aromatic ring-opening family dioxygenase [Amphritea sp. HPY]|uniref:DODA-type extradiol aromatic ring-opening family dioxygenase n=1 Tax=Amphritea sp. HPY TaxID=3421652 RepID=UPI003D7E3C06